MTWVLSLLLGVLVIALITAVTGYFVAQEFAYMAVDRSALRAQAAAGDQTSARALAVTQRTSFMLSGAQLGITVTGLLVGYVAEPLVGKSLGTALSGVGISKATGVAIGTVIALLFSTVIQMLFGELVPKNLAITKPTPVARALARSTQIYLAALGWLIWVFDAAANALLRLVRIEPVHDVEHAATVRDLEHIVADSQASGELPPALSLLLARVLDFPERDAEHAMIPRSRVDAVAERETVAQIRERMATGHSRYPVLDRVGDVVGVVQLTDLLALDLPENAPTQAWRREPLVVPTAMSLPDVLNEMIRTGNRLASVIDEYGGFAGIITAEDLAEELVGEIVDEHDAEESPVSQTEDGCWLMAGDLHLDEVERTVGHDLPESDHETIAGLIIDVAGELPEAGRVIDIPLPPDPAELATPEGPRDRLLRTEVLEVERHVPAKVKAWIVEPEAGQR